VVSKFNKYKIMKNEIVKFIYQNQEVEFEIGNSNIMVNATEMAKIFGKYPKDFLILEQTQLFLNACCKPENFSHLFYFQKEISPNGNKEMFVKVIKGDGSISGTWMHRILALKFAAWLDSDFEVWVFKTIDSILNANYHALIERITAKEKKKIIKEKIMKIYSDKPEIVEYFELEEAEKEAKRKQLKSVKQQIKQYQFKF